MEVREPSAKYLARPGYKQTEVGMIPEDWEVSNLESITDPLRSISYGIVQTGPSIPNGIRCLRVVDIHDGKINTGGMITTSKVISESYKRTILKAEDLVTPLRGKVGVVALVAEDLAGCNLTRGLALIAVRSNWSARYCRQYISSVPTKKRLEQLMNGSALQEIPIATLRSFKIALPPTKAEQEAIAEALSDADALIEALEQLLAKKRDLKQGAMQELLTGKKRLPGFSGEWEVKRLGDVATFHKGKGLPKSALDAFGAEPCIHYGELFTQYSEAIRETISRTNSVEGGFRSIANDVLMPTSDVTPNGLAKASCIRISGVVLGGDILIIRLNAARLFGTFLSYVIRRAQEQILQLVTGSTVFHLYAADMKKFTFWITSVAEQQAIVEILEGMDAEIAALEAKLAKARSLKQGMMQELLTGRIRLV